MHDASSELSLPPGSSSDGYWTSRAMMLRRLAWCDRKANSFGRTSWSLHLPFRLLSLCRMSSHSRNSHHRSRRDTNARLAHQESEAFTQQVNESCERAASQEDRIASLEVSQLVETESYKRMVQELTTRLDNMKDDDDKESRGDILCQSLRNFQ
ncbi:hypothetical protein J3R83DRAFT_5320 [Lanmaoa asiatica]|nr:hypothetical protein J3R83DRAFT_5320 [Lanmaoa asiatica]